MSEIKMYSSMFATKMNYVLDLINAAPLQYGRAKAIEEITKEKGTTVNNWLFGGKLPRENKKLMISDALGVSYEYLFNDETDIKNISKPELYKDNKCYSIPLIDEGEIFNLKNHNIYPISNRLPIMFPHFDMIVKKYGTNIYITKLKECNFEPHIYPNSDVIYSEHVIFEDFRLLIHHNKNTNKLTVKRLIEEKGNFFVEYIEYINQGKKLIKEPINKSDDFLSIVMVYSNK